MSIKTQEIEEMFIGFDKGKIQALAIEEDKENPNQWRLKYRDGSKKVEFVDCESREFLEQLLIEFGGKNPETCKAHYKFLKMDGSWNGEDLLNLGHRITKVKVSARRSVASTPFKVQPPANTGHPAVIDSRKTDNSDFFKVQRHTINKCDYTRAFSDPSEFNDFLHFIKNDADMNTIVHNVDFICTESLSTNKQCKWVRTIAGDGTKRMVIELQYLDGISFRKCLRSDLFAAAGDMFDTPCKRVSIEKVKTPERNICLFAAEDGRVDVSEYQAAI